MSRTSWRSMACMLALSLGGLVVWADDPPAPAKPPKATEIVKLAEPVVIASNSAFDSKQDTPEPPPVVPMPLPPVVPAADPEPTPTPVPVPAPVPPATPAEAPALKAIPPIPPITPPANEKPACFDKPEIQRLEPDPPAKPITPVVPIVNVSRTAEVTTPVTKVVPSIPTSGTPFPWKIAIEFVGGVTNLEIRHGEEQLLRIQCERLELATPAAGLQATGKVVVSGPCLEARCEKISVAWQSGQVALDGGVYLSFQNKGVVQVMRAESLCFRLTGSNVPVEFNARDVHNLVSPQVREASK